MHMSAWMGDLMKQQTLAFSEEFPLSEKWVIQHFQRITEAKEEMETTHWIQGRRKYAPCEWAAQCEQQAGNSGRTGASPHGDFIKDP